MTPADLAQRISAVLGGRPVQWSPAERQVGDYDGRQRTIEVFDAAAGDQRQLLRTLRLLRAEVERLIGGPLIVIFHTPAESERLYPTIAAERDLGGSFERRNRELAALVTAWMAAENPDEPAYDPDKIARLTVEAA